MAEQAAKGKAEAEPIFFDSPDAFRGWLSEHHQTEKECLVGYYKKGTGKPSMTWPESVDEALCCGWIDGVRKGIDEERYMIRFTPRKTSSIWSTVNIKRVPELEAEGRMKPEGLRAFELRKEAKSSIYAYEQAETAALSEDEEREFQANAQAWTYFQAAAPSYRRSALWYIVSAKRPETRRKRLLELIEASAGEQRLGRFTRPGKK